MLDGFPAWLGGQEIHARREEGGGVSWWQRVGWLSDLAVQTTCLRSLQLVMLCHGGLSDRFCLLFCQPEYIGGGSLYDLLHNRHEKVYLTWLIRIASDIAGPWGCERIVVVGAGKGGLGWVGVSG